MDEQAALKGGDELKHKTQKCQWWELFMSAFALISFIVLLLLLLLSF